MIVSFSLVMTELGATGGGGGKGFFLFIVVEAMIFGITPNTNSKKPRPNNANSYST